MRFWNVANGASPSTVIASHPAPSKNAIPIPTAQPPAHSEPKLPRGVQRLNTAERCRAHAAVVSSAAAALKAEEA